MKHFTSRLSPLALLAASTSAFAGADVINDGLIEQVVSASQGIEMAQQYVIGGVQAVNLVAAQDKVNNDGKILQTTSASSFTLSQTRSAGATQAINAVIAGNPAASIPSLGLKLR